MIYQTSNPNPRQPQSGALAGALILALAIAGAAVAPAATLLTNADGVIRNSLCVGFDCPNNPSFSDSTILLQENNTRIKFDDTSTINSFPRNDWELQANSSANGGPNRFAINDCGEGSGSGCADDPVFAVEAGARENALYVESDGDVGIGTSNPVTEIHAIRGDTPTLRLEQDGSSGFEPQTWDIAGNETNFFIRDVTNGSTLPFRIRPGASSNVIFISPDDDVVFNGSSAGAATTTTIQNTTTAGASDIHVASANNQDAVIGLGDNPDFSGGNSDALIFGYNGSFQVGSGFIGTRPTSDPGNAPINFLIENVIEMTLSASGLDLAAGNDFSVNGMALNVPDYVFEEDYALMPIAELASFVTAEKRLPGIPSGKELQQKSVGLAGFQMKLLEKVEELVLYTLDQQETIERQAAELAALSARLEALERSE